MPRVPPRLARSLATNLLWLAAGDGLVKAGLLAVAVLVGRGLGAAPLGLFTVAVGVVMVAVPLLALGQVEVVIRETAAAPGRARALLAAARAAQRRLLLTLALPLAAALLLVPAAPELAATLAAFLPYVVLRVDTITRAAAFKGLDRMDVEARARLLELAGAVGGTALAVVAAAPVWVVGASFSLGSAAAWAWIRRRCRELPLAGGGVPVPPAIGRLVAEGLPFFAIAVLFQLLLRGDALLLASLGVNAAEIGFYGAATTVTWGVLALSQLGGLALYPTLSRLAAAGGSPRTAAAVAAAVGIAGGAAAAAVLGLASRPLVELVFGPDLGAAAELLGIVAWALPGAVASMLLGTVIAAWRAQRRSLAWLAAILVLALALEIAWIPALGTAGAARAVVLAHGFGAAGNLVIALTADRGRGGRSI